MSEPIISRVYDLKIAGFDDSLSKVKTLTDAFIKMDAVKANLNKQLQNKTDAGDTASVQALTAKIKELETGLKSLDKQREASKKEALLQAQIDKTRTSDLIQQEKEIDRLIAIEDKRNKQTKASTGYYYDLLTAQKAALELYRTTPPASPFYEQVKKGAVDAKAKVDLFNRSLSPDGTLIGEYKSGIINAFKELGLSDVLKQQRNEINNNLTNLKSQATTLAAEFRQTGVTGQKAFAEINTQLSVNIQEQERLKASLSSIDSSLNNTGTIGSQITAGIANGFKNVKTQATQLLLGYVGIQAAFQGVVNLVHENAELSDSFADLRIRIKGTDQDVTNLVDSLKKIDTRTSLSGLVDIANVVAKKGVAKDQIAGITQALDSLFVTLGKEAGDPHEATSSIVKLISIFNDDKHVTADRVNEIGTSLFKLTTTGVATGSFLIDFAERVGSVRGITGLTLPNILGMGAALQQLGTRSEVAGTAAVQLATKMFGNVPKFAEAAGKSVEDFRKLLADNPFEALIAVAQNLKGSGKDFEEVVQAFGEIGISGARIKTVLADIATNGDFVKQKMAAAAVSTEDYGNQSAAAALKQNTFAATIQKIVKQFELAGTSRGFQLFLTTIATALSLVLSNIVPIITVLGIFGLGWLTVATEIEVAGVATSVTNGQLLLQRAALILNNAVLRLTNLFTIAVSIAQSSYNAVLSLFTGIAGRAAIATTLFGNAMRLLPLGIIITLVAVVIGAFKAFGGAVSGTTEALRQQALQAKISAEINQEVNKRIGEQQGHVAALAATVNNLQGNQSAQLKVMQELIAIDPSFNKALTGQTVNLTELAKATDEYNKKLRQTATLEVAKERQTQEFKKLGEISNVRQELEIFKATPDAARDRGTLSDDAKKVLDFSIIGTEKTFGNASEDEVFKQAFVFLDKAEAAQKKIADVTTNVLLLNEKTKEKIDAATSATTKEVSVFDKFDQLIKNNGTEEQFSNLQQEIEDQKKKTSLISDDYKKLDALQQKVKDLLDPTKKKAFAGSKLSGEQKDAFKDIEATRDEQIAIEKLKFTQLITNEEEYLTNVLKINTTAADAKLALIKGKNAEERKVIADLKVYQIEQEQETNKKLFDLAAKRLERAFDDAKKQADITRANVVDDPKSTTVQKTLANETYFSTVQALQITFNSNMDSLEKKFGQHSGDNAQKRKDELIGVTKELYKTILQLTKDQYDEEVRLTEEANKREQDAIKQTAAEKITAVLSDDSISRAEQARQIKKIELEETAKQLKAELELTKQILKEKLHALKDGLATETEISDAKKNLATAQAAVLKNSAAQEQSYFSKLKDSLKGALANITNYFKGIKASQEQIDAAINAGVETIKNAVSQAKQQYFDNKRQQIDDEKQTAIDRLNLEEQQVLNTTDSEAEKDTIRRQFDAKRKEEEKKAGEEKKQLAVKQLSLDFAVAVVKTLAAYPFPFSLIPVAGLAIAYALQRSAVQAQKFAGGGRVLPEPIGNGRITASSNIPTQPNGDSVLATVKPNEVILNEEQQRRLGGARTFARIGVPGFAGGGITGFANLRSLGDSLRAPINPSSFLSGFPDTSDNSKQAVNRIDTLIGLIGDSHRQTNTRIDRLQVILDPMAVEKSNDRTRKATSIGTL